MPWKEHRLWSQLDLGSTPSLGNLVVTGAGSAASLLEAGTSLS